MIKRVVNDFLSDVLGLVFGVSTMVGVTAAICYLDTFIDIVMK